MASVPRLSVQRLRGEIRREAVAVRRGPDHGLEGHGVVRGGEGVGKAEVDLVLARTLLVAGALRADPHLLQGQTDLPPDVLPPVLGRDVHVARPIVGDFRGPSVLVRAEEVKGLLQAEEEGEPRLLRFPCRRSEQAPGVRGMGRPVRLRHGRIHPHHPAVLRTPGKDRQRRGIGAQGQTGFPFKTADGGGIKRNPPVEGPLQLVGHDGNVLLPSVHVAEGQADELHVLFPHVLQHFVFCVIHDLLLSVFHVHSAVRIRAVRRHYGEG